MLNVGAQRDYDLDLIDGTIRTGERGIILRFTRGEEKFLCFLGLDEAVLLSIELKTVATNISKASAVKQGVDR